jgi:N-acetylmuramoyl-L-alanine amidase
MSERQHPVARLLRRQVGSREAGLKEGQDSKPPNPSANVPIFQKGILRSIFYILHAVLAWLGLGLMLVTLGLLMREWPLPSSLQPLKQPIVSGQFMTVVIDPGHGGVDEGASARGLKEKTVTLDVAQRLAAALNRHGLTALLTRKDDEYLSLPARVALAEAVPDAIFISLHCNFSDLPESHGLEIYRCLVKGEDRLIRVADAIETLATAEDQLAQSLDRSVASGLHIETRGEKDANFFVLRNVDYPSVLVECGFLTNPEESKRLQDPSYRENLAESLAVGIVAYHSLTGASHLSPNKGAAATTTALISQ